MKTLLDWAVWYYNQGLCVLPVRPRAKAPLVEWKRYQTQRPSRRQVEDWFRGKTVEDCGIGVVCGAVSGGYVVLDFDRLDAYRQALNADRLEKMMRVIISGSGKRHLPMFSKHVPDSFKIPEIGLEVRSNRNFTVLPPSIHPCGRPYRFVNPQLPVMRVENAAEEAWKIAAKLGIDRRPDVKKAAWKPDVSLLRPCFRAMINNKNPGALGEKPNELCNEARLALVQEALSAGFGAGDIAPLFSNQADYGDGRESRRQVAGLAKKAIEQGIHRYNCDTLITKGWCTAADRDACYLKYGGRPLTPNEAPAEQAATPLIFPTPSKGGHISPISLDEVAEILGTTIKADDTNKRILFLNMLLNYTEEDQQNIAFNAPSSTGKSYLALQIADYFPEEDVLALGYTSPKAFFHELGEQVREDGTPLQPRDEFVNENLDAWVKLHPKPESGEGVTDWKEELKAERRRLKIEWDEIPKLYLVNLERRIIIFIDQPHDQLLQYLRSLLSHDRKRIRIKIADKTREGRNRTKTIELVGYPTVIFNSTRFSLAEQERTRLWLLSPEMTQTKLRGSIKLLGDRLANRLSFRKALDADEGRRRLKRLVAAVKAAGIQQILIRDEDRDRIVKRFLDEHRNLAPRLQRDFPRLVALCKAHALLNFMDRQRTADGGLWANRSDVDLGYELYSKISESNELGIPPQVYRLYNERIKPVFDKGGSLSRRELAREYFNLYKTRIGKKALKRTVDLLLETGLAVEQPDPDDKRMLRIYPPGMGGGKNEEDPRVTKLKRDANQILLRNDRELGLIDFHNKMSRMGYHPADVDRILGADPRYEIDGKTIKLREAPP